MDALFKDWNWVGIHLLPPQIPLAVTRKTNLTTVAADVVASWSWNAATKLITVFSKTYDLYLYFYGTGRTATVSATVFHRFVPAWVPVDLLVPADTTKLTGIAEEWTIPLLIVEQY